MGATPASIANAASEWMQPGWDQAHSTVAATIGPTELLEQVRTPAADDGQDRLLQLAGLLQHRVCARAKVRRATTVLVVSTSHEE
jgi:hypothetical protein